MDIDDQSTATLWRDALQEFFGNSLGALNWTLRTGVTFIELLAIRRNIAAEIVQSWLFTSWMRGSGGTFSIGRSKPAFREMPFEGHFSSPAFLRVQFAYWIFLIVSSLDTDLSISGPSTLRFESPGKDFFFVSEPGSASPSSLNGEGNYGRMLVSDYFWKFGKYCTEILF